MEKLKYCALAAKIGSKPTSVSLAKYKRLCLFGIGNFVPRELGLGTATYQGDRDIHNLAWPCGQKGRVACVVHIAT
jgi:hypothetical protein